jgi:hypothetical protein
MEPSFVLLPQLFDLTDSLLVMEGSGLFQLVQGWGLGKR